MIPSDEVFPFVLVRMQFPIRPAFAITFNKSQGQTFQKLGIYLPQPVWTHGQLYVAASRVGSAEDIEIMITSKDNSQTQQHTRNIVYKEVL